MSCVVLVSIQVHAATHRQPTHHLTAVINALVSHQFIVHQRALVAHGFWLITTHRRLTFTLLVTVLTEFEFALANRGAHTLKHTDYVM